MIMLKEKIYVSYCLCFLFSWVYIVCGDESKASVKIPQSDGLIVIRNNNHIHHVNTKNESKNYFTLSSTEPNVVSSCSSDTITFNYEHIQIQNKDGVHESNWNKYEAEKMQPGGLFIQIIDDDEVTTGDDNLGIMKNECNPLFRKIVEEKIDERDESTRTYVTTYATFSDVFPSDFYDRSLSDMHLEPIFREYDETISETISNNIIGSNKQQQQTKKRNLEENNEPNPDDCLAIPFTTMILGALSICSLCLPCILPASVFLVPLTIGGGTLASGLAALSIIGLPIAPILFVLTLLCSIIGIGVPLLLTITPLLVGIWGITLITLVTSDTCNYGFSSARAGDSFMMRDFLMTSDGEEIITNDDTRGRFLHEENSKQEFRKLPMVLPKTCDDWMSKSDLGNCNYVDCNVGRSGDATKCYANCDSDECTVSHLVPFSSSLPTGFSDAMCMLDHCYSSNILDRESCDIHFYKSLVSTCSGTERKAETTSIAKENIVDTTVGYHHQLFPIERTSFISGIGSHCQMASVMLYLSAKVLGQKIYESRQKNQMLFNQKTFCSGGN